MKASCACVLFLLRVITLLFGHAVWAVEVSNSEDGHQEVAMLLKASGDIQKVTITPKNVSKESMIEASEAMDSRNILMRSEQIEEQAPTITPNTMANMTANATAELEPSENTNAHPLTVISLVIIMAFTCYVTNSLYTKRHQADAAEGADAGAPAATGESTASRLGDDESDGEQLRVEPLPEDTYGMVIAAMVRDLHHLAKETGSKHKSVRLARIFTSWGLLLANFMIQLMILVYITKFAAARAVHNIRGAYDVFETTLYDNHISKTSNGWARGSDDLFFNPDLFARLADDAKENACRIPLSQPGYLAIVLFIWTLMVIGDLRKSLLLFVRLVMGCGSTPTMADSCTNADDGDDMIITKLTIPLKAVIGMFVILPRILIAGYLLWLGCRWLTATNDFQDLVLNSVALEFVLLTKELMFTTLVSERSKRDTRRMQISVEQEAESPSPWSFLGAFMWGMCALAWVYLYMYSLQQVLPEYRWDVRDVCAKWIEDNFSGKI
eukprot:TRINITY_DN1255_c0_g2_i1.p1 TRINITY_DN1255_c0_g2~~TRINITY_DN1255_c0_g2_i1.p1  ORF type:complete len:497 (-),score=86.85 TRINITY_DN1255_c0_g2_i1:19-1509(-)